MVHFLQLYAVVQLYSNALVQQVTGSNIPCALEFPSLSTVNRSLDIFLRDEEENFISRFLAESKSTTDITTPKIMYHIPPP